MTRPKDFWALRVVSPMCLGGEQKDQDRARWFPVRRVACVCDGVSASPHGGRAAAMAAASSVMLFSANPEERLAALADTLVAYRGEARRKGVRIPAATSAAMRALMREAAAGKLENAYQTTLVATAFTRAAEHIATETIQCGDSTMLVMAADGEFLACSSQWENLADSRSMDPPQGGYKTGADILIKIVARADQMPEVADRTQIAPEYRRRWYVGILLDRCDGENPQFNAEEYVPVLTRTPVETLLIPEYLVGRLPAHRFPYYCRLRYSKMIRRLAQPVSGGDWTRKGSATAVLPDDIQRGRWVYHRDRFPLNANFILASDGFYESFDDLAQMWTWLTANESRLADPAQRAQVMRECHERLHRKRGDDDMSVVWVRTAETGQPEALMSGTDPGEQESDHVL